jgi:hypothetical protein
MMRKFLSVAIVLTALSMVHRACAADAPKPDWAQVLSPAQTSLPAPREKVVWLGELGPAMATAKAENRPLFVTFRCLPCKQCSAFDKNVLEGGPELDPLLKQFITVRLISAKDLDFRIFPAEGFQDLDLSWWGYFLSPEGRVYGIFGGRDEVSDETRISSPALVNTLRRVLAHHYDPRRAAWDIDGPAPDLAAAPRIITDLPGYASWADGRTLDKRTREAGCLHCHQVAEVLRQPAIDAKSFDKTKDTEVWPLPENVGVTVDRDDGLRVTGVRPDSPADRAGIKPGDALAMAGGRRLFGQADFRGVLHRGPHGAGTIDIAWLRQDAVRTGQLSLPDGWRKTNLGWRTSIANGNIGASPGFWPIPVSPQDRQKLKLPDAAMALRPLGISPEAKAAGLEPGSIITAIGDDASDLSGRPLLVWFRLLHEPGDEVTLTVRNGSGTSKKLTYKLPATAAKAG